jgi:DNA modification methylase
LETFPKSIKLSALYQDEFEPQLYDIWNFAKKTNEVEHFGNTEVRIVDNLLYTFTEPFDIVIDPFAGGASTIDICKKRMRRYWVSDRKPIPAREKEIRKHDIVTDGISGPARWGDVALVYLDPPYWKQSEGKYSDDPTDLANMPLDKFTETLVNIIHEYGKKLKPGAHIACIISPTQWPNEDKHTDYHDIDLACRVHKNLKLERRVIAPYSCQQYNGTQVDIAKARKLCLVLSRTLLVWSVTQ